MSSPFNQTVVNGTFEKQTIYLRLTLEGLEFYITLIYVALFLVALLGNVRVAWIVGWVLFCGRGGAAGVERGSTPKSVQLYIFSLCLSDLLMLVCMSLLLHKHLLGAWQAGQLACQVYVCLDALNKFSAPFVLAALSATCYGAVRLKNRASAAAAALRDGRLAALVVTLATLATVGLTTPVLLAHSRLTELELAANASARFVLRVCAFAPSEQLGLAFNAYVCLLAYLLPSALFCYCYAGLVCFLRRRSMRRSLWKKVGRTAAGLVSVYLLCWTPYWLLVWLTFFVPLPPNFVALSYLGHLLPYVSATAYPLLYTLLNRSIADEHALLRQRFRRRVNTARRAAGASVTARLTTASAASRQQRGDTRTPTAVRAQTSTSCNPQLIVTDADEVHQFETVF